MDAYGEPLEMMQVQVWEQRVSGGRRVLASVLGTRERQTDDRGAYRLYGLLPGTDYVVAHGGASVAARVRMTTSLAMGDSITAAAALLATHPAVQVFHPGSPHPDMDPRSFAVGVVPADPDLFSGAPNAQSVVREGMPAFEFTGFSGPVRFELRRALPGWYLQSAVIDGVDAADYPVTLGPSTGQGHMVDVVLAEGGAIVGSVTDADGAPARDYHVVVFPADASRWYYRSRWLKLSRADAGGGFDVPGLPPGEYWAAAVDWIAGDETDGAWQTPDVLGSLVPGAQRVRVRGIERVPVTLRLTRMP